MATNITIKELPEATLRELTDRAARRGLSLQEFLRTILIDTAATADGSDLLARIGERKRALGTKLTVDAILNHRSAERR